MVFIPSGPGAFSGPICWIAVWTSYIVASRVSHLFSLYHTSLERGITFWMLTFGSFQNLFWTWKNLQNSILVFWPNSNFIHNYSNRVLPFPGSSCYLKRFRIFVSKVDLVLVGPENFLINCCCCMRSCAIFSCTKEHH